MSALNPETCGLALAPLACKTVFTPRLQGTWGFHQPSLTPLFLRVSAPCPAPGPALGEAGRWGGGGELRWPPRPPTVAAAATALSPVARPSALTLPDQGALQGHLFWESGTPSPAWGEALFAGEGGAWNRSQRHPSPDQQDRTG